MFASKTLDDCKPLQLGWSATGIAEFERSLIATRTEEGRRAAQARGVSFGRPPKLRPDQRTLARNLIEEGKSVSDVARTFNAHVATSYRCLHDEAAL